MLAEVRHIYFVDILVDGGLLLSRHSALSLRRWPCFKAQDALRRLPHGDAKATNFLRRFDLVGLPHCAHGCRSSFGSPPHLYSAIHGKGRSLLLLRSTYEVPGTRCLRNRFQRVLSGPSKDNMLIPGQSLTDCCRPILTLRTITINMLDPRRRINQYRRLIFDQI